MSESSTLNMTTDQTRFPEALEGKVFAQLRQTAQSTGQAAYVIGGYVRDFLLGKRVKDIDIVVEGDGPAFARAFAKRVGSRNVNIFKNFGTAMVVTDSLEVEFVGARKESYSRNSRNPTVVPGTLTDDQLRRDFTINALSFSLNPDDFGALKDPFDGLADLRAGLIRTPTDPELTFSDDPLRMLRAARFAAKLQFKIVPETFEAMKRNAQRIEIVSQERIADEFNKLLMSPKPSVGLKILFSTGLLKYILPELEKLQGVEVREGVRHKDNFYHTLKVLDNIVPSTDSLWLRWAALLHDIAKPKTKRFHKDHGWTFHAHEDVGSRWVPKIFKRMRLPLDAKMKYVQKLVRLHQRPIALTKDIVSDAAIRRIIVEAGDDLDDLLTLCRADITTKDPRRESRYLENYNRLEERIKHCARTRRPAQLAAAHRRQRDYRDLQYPPFQARGHHQRPRGRCDFRRRDSERPRSRPSVYARNWPAINCRKRTLESLSMAQATPTDRPKQRILLLHGFGDDARSYEVLSPQLAQRFEPEYVDYYSLCDDLPLSEVTAASYAERIIEQHNVSSDDILLGHSMGGYIAHAIRQQVDAPCVLIGSFIDPRKIRYAIMYFWLIRVAVFLGFFTTWLLRLGGWLKYRKAEGNIEATISAEALGAQSRRSLYRLLRTFFVAVPPPTPTPELAFHGTYDDVVAPPDFVHLAIPGNHFIHRTRVDIIVAHIEAWRDGRAYSQVIAPQVAPQITPPSAKQVS